MIRRHRSATPSGARRFAVLFGATVVLAAAAAGADAPVPESAPEQADVVVVGGGPGGLAAAIEARLAGAHRVVVLERRGAERDRQQVVVIGQGALDHIERLGVDVHDTGVFAPLRTADFSRDEPGSGLVTYRLSDPLLGARTAVRTGIFEVLPPHPVVGVAINQLERSLLAAAERLGVIVHHDSEVVGVDASDTGVTATVQDSRGRRAVRGGVLVVADGARSPTSAMLGVTRQTRPGSQETFAWAIFAQPGRGAHFRSFAHTEGAPYAVVQIGSPQGISVGIGLPAGTRLEADADKEAYVRRWAAEVGVTGPMIRPPTVFTTASGMTEQVLLGAPGRERVFILGDAARNDSPWYGTGTQAAVLDAARFGQTFRVLLDPHSSPRQRARALARYRSATNSASRALQRFGRFMQDRCRPPARLATTSVARSWTAPAPVQRLLAAAGRLGSALKRRVVELGVNRGRLVRNPAPGPRR